MGEAVPGFSEAFCDCGKREFPNVPLSQYRAWRPLIPLVFFSEHLPVAPASSGALLLLLTLAVLAGPICRPQGEFSHLVCSPDFPCPDLGKRMSGGEGLTLNSLNALASVSLSSETQGNQGRRAE